MLPNYQVVFISCRTGETIHVLDASAVDDLQYSRVLDGVGTFAMSIPIENPFAAELVALGLDAMLDTFVEVYRTSPVTGSLILEDTYLLRLLHRFREENVERIAIGGFSLNHLLLRRIVDPDQDPFQAGGYSTKAGRASNVMREYIVQQCGSGAGTRAFPLFNVPAIGDYGTNVGRRLRFENLLEVLQGISLTSDCDFIVERGLGNVLNCNVKTIGIDRRYSTNYPNSAFTIISPLRGNMNNPSLLYDRKEEQTVIYAQGQGQGTNRKLVRIAGDGVADSPYNRIEFVSDVRTSEKADALTLYTEGQVTLREARPKKEFTFEIIGNEAGNTYRDDWDIGDFFTAEWDDFMLEVRVSKVEVTVSSSGESIAPTTEAV